MRVTTKFLGDTKFVVDRETPAEEAKKNKAYKGTVKVSRHGKEIANARYENKLCKFDNKWRWYYVTFSGSELMNSNEIMTLYKTIDEHLKVETELIMGGLINE